jgi:hypothetical protein
MITTDTIIQCRIDGSLKSMQDIVDGYIEIVTLGKTLRMIVNEEGLLRDLKVNYLASMLYGHEIRGDVFCCSYDGKENLVDLSTEDFELVFKKIDALTKKGLLKPVRPTKSAEGGSGYVS